MHALNIIHTYSTNYSEKSSNEHNSHIYWHKIASYSHLQSLKSNTKLAEQMLLWKWWIAIQSKHLLYAR